jgi:hypothetical protein
MSTLAMQSNGPLPQVKVSDLSGTPPAGNIFSTFSIPQFSNNKMK